MIALPGGHAKVIDWRYQDTFLARSTASRNELVEADERQAIYLVASLFEKQGLRDESFELRRVSGVAAAQAFIDRVVTAASAHAVPPTELVVAATGFPPPPVRLDRATVNDNEKTEDQNELAIWPVQESDLDTSELLAEIDSLVRRGVTTAAINMMFKSPPVETTGARRWPLTYRPYTNVIQKWELEIRDHGFFAFRWAQFRTGDHLRYETRELLDAIVVPIHLYELATASAVKNVSVPNIARANLRLTVVGTSGLVLHDDACVTAQTMYSRNAEARLEARLEVQLPGQPGAIAARLINRVLSNFHVERDPFGDQRSSPTIVRLDSEAYEKYLYTVGVKKAPG